MKNIKNKKGGISIIGLIVFVIITVLVLNYFNINVRKIAQSHTGQENINYVVDNGKTVAITAWQKYIKDELTHIWKDIILKIFIQSFIDSMTGKINFQEQLAPVMPTYNGNTQAPPTQ